MKRLIWAFLSLLLLPTLSWGQHDLSGRIVDKNTSEPLAGVVLTLTEIDAQVETNQAGVYRFSDVPEGTYNLVVRAENYLSFGIRISVRANKSQDFRMILTKNVTDEVLITAIKASDQTATTYSVLDQEAIQKRNFGQDVPFLLNEIPGVVVNSDAGAGIGYTAMRIRGSDATRINITLNGIPYNDPESHGTFWVNLPDFASSVDNIQVQRGVGNSTNGAAAFGASINLQTTKLNYEPYAELANSYGSFNTWKNTLTAGTGLIKDKFSFDLRLSNIHSDGWVDRAETDLRSFFVSGGYYGKKTLLKFNVFAGQERTYQSWWGVPEEYLDDPVLRRDNYYTYENETDNYWQDHYQLLFAHELSDELNLNLALHYTKGRGYFEQFREGDSFREYPIFSFNELVVNNDTLTETNLIRRRWLDNDFYGTTYSLDYQPSDRIRLTLGGAANQYDGDHFGEVIWAEHAQGTDLGDRYYDNRALKTDVNTYLKGSIQLTDALNLYADLQYRHIDYQIGDSTLERPGNDNDQSPIIGDFNFN
ncbi:MAG: carboxypeptidase regulatory-like domain-containing protein, partial [Bacteroidota bacterium]